MNKVQIKEWISVQDCKGNPLFPREASNIRNKLEKLLNGRPELKRKKEKSKAYEYHISILPEHMQQSFGYTPKTDEQKTSNNKLNDNEKIWMMIFDRLNQKQQQLAIDTFFIGGVSALLPAVVDAVENETGREILQQRDSAKKAALAEQGNPQDKKAS